MFTKSYLEITSQFLPAIAREGDPSVKQRPVRIQESVAHALWLEQPWAPHHMQDVKGNRIEIVSPGWMSGGPGPDFKGALYKYNGNDVEKGDVEIHVRSSDWIRHKHHKDPAYNQTKIHVVLYCDSVTDPRMTQAGEALIEVELGSIYSSFLDKLRSESGLAPDKTGLNKVTGKCNKSFELIGLDKTSGLICAAGEGRIELKSVNFSNGMAQSSNEDILYQGLVEALGYTVYKAQFKHLAQSAPLGRLRPALLNIGRNHRPMVLESILLGVAGLIPGNLSQAKPGDKESAEYLTQIREVWSDYSSKFQLEPIFTPDQWPLKGTRPANYPYGRLAGLAQFLAFHIDSELEVLFARYISDFPTEATLKERQEWLNKVAMFFNSSKANYWNHHYLPGGAKLKNARKLVSSDRVALLIINILIPYYLALAKKRDDKEAQKRLRKLFYTIPAPAPNSIVKFMEQMTLKGQGSLPRGFKTAVTQQGLIQIYNDFCMASPDGCHSCRFATYLERLAKLDN